uniref:Wall-associated receptor kinase galacturonan-binding domain-containing protein n=1 Tax=Chenopodium quinoa TaxID=63459 RepID=A0A803KWQ1_CHEQI
MMEIVRPLSPFSFFIRLWYTFFAMRFASIPIAKPGCGKVTIPYPFGIDSEKSCSLSTPYNIHCDTSFDPPQPYLFDNNDTRLEIIDISQTGQMRIRNKLATRCYQPREVVEESIMNNQEQHINLANLPLVVSDTANKFIGIGCDDDLAMMVASTTLTLGHLGGCVTSCYSPEDILKQNDTSCLGNGCCQSEIPNKGLKIVMIIEQPMVEVGNTTNNDVFYCSAAF